MIQVWSLCVHILLMTLFASLGLSWSKVLGGPILPLFFGLRRWWNRLTWKRIPDSSKQPFSGRIPRILPEREIPRHIVVAIMFCLGVFSQEFQVSKVELACKYGLPYMTVFVCSKSYSVPDLFGEKWCLDCPQYYCLGLESLFLNSLGKMTTSEGYLLSKMVEPHVLGYWWPENGSVLWVPDATPRGKRWKRKLGTKETILP